MSDATRDSSIVFLLDWQGRLVWYSDENPDRPTGKLALDYARDDYRASGQAALRQVIQDRKPAHFHLFDDLQEYYCVWVWPMESREIAACGLANRVPAELAQLSPRERDCMTHLGEGRSAADVAEQLGISISTVHTHFRRAREKLNLPTLEALISFASRYCVQPACPNIGQPFPMQG